MSQGVLNDDELRRLPSLHGGELLKVMIGALERECAKLVAHSERTRGDQHDVSGATDLSNGMQTLRRMLADLRNLEARLGRTEAPERNQDDGFDWDDWAAPRPASGDAANAPADPLDGEDFLLPPPGGGQPGPDTADPYSAAGPRPRAAGPSPDGDSHRTGSAPPHDPPRTDPRAGATSGSRRSEDVFGHDQMQRQIQEQLNMLQKMMSEMILSQLKMMVDFFTKLNQVASRAV